MKKALVRILIGSIAVALVAVAAVFVWNLHRQNIERREKQADACAACLPADLTLDTEFCVREADRRVYPARTVTIRKKLIEVGGYCQNGIIYDSAGREIRFKWLYEWGGPAPTKDQWQEHLERQKSEEQELKDLKNKYHVIEMLRSALPL